MHPLVKEYIESSAPFETILKRYHENEPTNKMYEMLYNLKLNLVTKRSEPLVYKFSDEFLLEKKYDTELIILFYQLSANLAYYYNKPEMGRMYFKRAEAYINKFTPPYLILPTKANLCKGKEFIKFIEEHLLKYSHTSPRYSTAFEIYFLQLACLGVMPNDNLIKKYLKKDFNESKINKITMSKFVYFLETFQISELNALQPKIFDVSFSIGEGSGQYSETLPHYKLLYQALFETNKWSESYFSSNKNILTMYYLINRNPQKALQVAKEFSVNDMSPLLSLNLVRCELSNKNFESAFQNLKKYIEEDSAHFYIYFFYARIELGRGNRDIACQYYAKALEIAKKNNAEGLVDFELSLAYELSMSDLRYLIENSNKVKEKSISQIKSLITPIMKAEDKIIGSSPEILEIKNKIANYADSDIPVLITGETGVGKELVAKALHQQSKREKYPYVAINCGSLSESLLLSELFGHEAGSFTGANKSHKGLFESVGKGSIFLDEIGEITPALQIALLRVLDQNEYKAVGSNTFKKCQCRILFATNANLEKLVLENKFRKDLLFRLKRLEINIPSLKNRKADIPELVRHYLSIGRSDNKTPEFTTDFITTLQNYPWPGNIRQLKNEIEKIRLLFSEKLAYVIDDLPDFLKKPNNTDQNKISPTDTSEAIKNPKENTVENILIKSKNPIRRLDKLKELFQQHKKFTRKELIEITKLAPKTVSRDLEELCDEGAIERIMPNKMARTHYFILKQ